MATLRRLPYVPVPEREEALASWVDRTSAYYEIGRTDTWVALGLTAAASDQPRRYGVNLTPTELAAVVAASGLDREAVLGMLLARYDGTCLDFDRHPPAASSGNTWPSAAWAYVWRSRACPECVQESGGVWHLSWKVPWAVVCGQHRRYLAGACPKCGTSLQSVRKDARQRIRCCGPVRRVGTRWDGRPRTRRHRDDICGAPVADIATPAVQDSELLELQSRLLGLLNADGDERGVAKERFAELRACYTLALYMGSMELIEGRDPIAIEAFERHEQRRLSAGEDRATAPSHRAYRSVPLDPALTAAGLLIAGDLVFASNPEAACRRFVDITSQRAAASSHWTALTRFWRPPERLEPALEIGRGRHMWAIDSRLDGRARNPTTGHAWLSWRNVPQLAWRGVYRQVTAGLLDGGWELYRRRFVSVSLARWLSPELSSFPKAAAALGLPPKAVATCNTLSSRLRQEGLGEDYAQRLADAIKALESQGELIDYADRRRALSGLELLAADDWEWVLATAPAAEPTIVEPWHREATAWLWVMLTGGDFNAAPGLQLATRPPSKRRRMAARYVTDFCGRHLPKIERELRIVGRRILARTGLPGPLELDPVAEVNSGAAVE